MTYEHYDMLKISVDQRIMTITMSRPAVKNAVNPALHDELSRIFADADRDTEVDVIILTGAGGAFSAGGDLDWLKALHGDPVATARSIQTDRRIQNALLDLEKPILAKVNGPAIGLGCSLALFCDFVYATPELRFADPHVAVGLVAGDGGAVIWPQLIGYARAKRYLLTGDAVLAPDAAQMGLITECVAAAEIDAVVQAMAQRLATVRHPRDQMDQVVDQRRAEGDRQCGDPPGGGAREPVDADAGPRPGAGGDGPP